MNKENKQLQIDLLFKIFNEAEAIILSSINGVGANELNSLRKSLTRENLNFFVVKNKLAKVAAKKTKASAIFDDFNGSTALTWSKGDAVLPAKVLMKFQEQSDFFQIKAGLCFGERLNKDLIKELAKLPSVSELRSNMLSAIKVPMSQLLTQINSPAINILGLIEARLNNKKEESKNG